MIFQTRLRERLHAFDIDEAVKLSDELHNYEKYGGELSTVEDMLWFSLTLKIQTHRTTIKRARALNWVAYAVDNALSERKPSEMPVNARLIGWQCGFEPLFVAVWSYLGDILDDAEAIELAIDLLKEKKWFCGDVTPPDYVL